MKNEQVDAVKIAEKQRHLYLLQKIKGNKPLTAAELKELENYEKMSKKTKKKVLKRDKTTGKFMPRGMKGEGRGMNDEQLASLATELKQLAAIDKQFESHFDDILDKYPRIKTALEQAISQRVEDVIRERFATIPAQRDYRNITLNQLKEITGKTRRTIYDWLKKGLPRNADGTFNLSAFIIWFEKYTVEKLPAQVVASINPLTKMKADRLELDLARQRNQVLDRGEVMAGQIARHQNLINSLSHKAEDLAMLCHGQPQVKITELLNTFFDDVLKQQCQVPEELCLPPEIAEKFGEILKGLVVSS